MINSFILGLSSGSACVATCGMAMFPYLMSGGAGVRRITIDLSLFLLVRFIAYFILATISWYFGQAVFSNSLVRIVLPGILYIFLSILLIYYSIRSRKPDCPAKMLTTINNKRLIPIIIGLVNSLGFCPALLIALTEGATQGSILMNYYVFVAFFIGSSLWFIPIPFAGKIKKVEVLKTIGILASGLAGIIFMIKGITILIGGLINE